MQQAEKTHHKRYYISFFNATDDIVGNLCISKARGAGDTKAIYSDFSFNVVTGFAEGLVEFAEQIWSDKLEESLAQRGAACITMVTFPHNDANKTAGAALARIWETAKGPDFALITRGACNPKLFAKAQEITEHDANDKKQAAQKLDEKTNEAMNQSLKEMTTNMVTKDDLAKAGETTKQSIEKIKESLGDDYAMMIASQAKTIKELESIITTKDRDNQTLEDKNYSQRCVLARLNQEKIDDAKTIKKLNEKIENQGRTILDLVEKNQALGDNSKNIIEEKICEVHSFMQVYIANEESRKRKPV